MKATLPLISCICVTRQRPALLERSIACFRAQSYPEKELLILYETDDTLTGECLARPLEENISVVPVTPSSGVHLGALRNLAIAHAKGDYICQWDDDDWYHPGRLQYQYDLLTANNDPACVLGHFLMFDTYTSKGFLSCFRSWEGSLLCEKTLAARHSYYNLRRGEDTPLIHALQQERLLFTDTAPTPYYHYIYHGENTWDYGHFSCFFHISKALPEALSACMERLLSAEQATPENIEELETLFKQTYGFSK